LGKSNEVSCPIAQNIYFGIKFVIGKSDDEMKMMMMMMMMNFVYTKCQSVKRYCLLWALLRSLILTGKKGTKDEQKLSRGLSVQSSVIALGTMSK